MDTVALYETTFAERDHGYAVSFIMVPARTLWQPDGFEQATPYEQAQQFGHDLDLRVLGGFDRVAYVPQALASIIRYSTDVDAAFSEGSEGEDPALHEFAERAVFGRVLAAEASPISAESLANLVTGKPVTAGAAGLGIAAVAFGSTPLLLIAAPVGIILVGASLGVAEALQHGLRKKLLQRMGVDEESEARSEVTA